MSFVLLLHYLFVMDRDARPGVRGACMPVADLLVRCQLVLHYSCTPQLLRCRGVRWGRDLAGNELQSCLLPASCVQPPQSTWLLSLGVDVRLGACACLLRGFGSFTRHVSLRFGGVVPAASGAVALQSYLHVFAACMHACMHACLLATPMNSWSHSCSGLCL